MSCACVNLLNLFCYACGEFTSKLWRRSITTTVKMMYELYFGCKVGDQDDLGTTFMLQ